MVKVTRKRASGGQGINPLNPRFVMVTDIFLPPLAKQRQATENHPHTGESTMPHITANGISIHYETHGEGPPLLFLHGLGSSLQDWAPQITPFASRFRVITMDLRGHGESEKPPGPYSIALLAQDAGALIEKITPDPAHVVGLSMGGAVALHLGLEYGHLLQSIVVTNMSAMVPVETFTQRYAYYGRLLFSAFFGPGAVGKHIARSVFPGPEMGGLRKAMAERWAKNPRRPYLASLDALKNWTLMERLREITVPALLIHSEHDYSPLSHKKEMAARMQRATLMTLPDTHHVVNMEAPASFNSLVMNFLSDQEAQR